MAYLALVRHGQSTYNQQGLWTGWADPELTEEGKKEAAAAGEAVKQISFDFGYSSILKRAIETLHIIAQVKEQPDLSQTANAHLNERNYGDYTGKNKWEIQKEVGEEVFQKIRRSWDFPIPNGESLKQVYDREIPYFAEEILPKLKEGKNIIIASSGNALRALVKHLENIPDEKVAEIEIATGQILLYTINERGEMTHKQILIEKKNTA